MKIEIYPLAEDDIIRQFRYYLVVQDAPDVAFRFREAVIGSIKQLESHPLIGVLVPCSIAGLLSWPVKDFEAIRLYYVGTPDVLRVARVLHDKRNVRQILRHERDFEK